MIGKKLLDEFNAQINEEAFSAYLYLSMSAWFESVNLPGSPPGWPPRAARRTTMP